MSALPSMIHQESDQGLPRYDLQAEHHGPDDLELEIWQVPSGATPYLKRPIRIAGLRGRNLALIEHRVLRLLSKADIRLGGLKKNIKKTYTLNEDLALNLGLLFRTLAPMRNRENMRMVADGIEAMGKEEAAYWLGMAMHRKYPRRVLMALRFLLIDPKAKLKD
ncbi:MAG: hypothetical protein K9K64_14320 [Desulfohalobiaceae bacterium]|nr:hypothetical protein [Desulfohalobiaceae bacterium]